MTSTTQLLEQKATRLRIHSVRATTAAGSGHPTSCASAAEIVSVLFFSVMRYDPTDPANPASDKFVLSKGHAAPVLYAAWAEAGAIPVDRLLTLRRFDSDLEGHPTPRLPFVDVATGSLGQGLSVGAGMALSARLAGSDQRVYVLMGDGESAEGSVWEAAEVAGKHGLSNLCAVIDMNRLGQSQPTMLEHDMETARRRWEGFGWNALVVDGHNIEELLRAFDAAAHESGRPSIVLARTFKGHGLLELNDVEGEHGKPLSQDNALKAVAQLEGKLNGDAAPEWNAPRPSPPRHPAPRDAGPPPDPPYAPGGKEIATRRAFGEALAALAKTDPRVVVLDGDVKNSTYTELFEKAAPERFFQGYIAEQNLLGMAMGLTAGGWVPFAATFGAFFSRAYDFIRMAAVSGNNIKLVGTHAGVSIGEDGPSQMALEDLAMTCAQPDFVVLYPSDATSAWRAVTLAAQHHGPCYLRMGRPNSPVFYGPQEEFAIGRAKLVRQSPEDRALIVGAGVTLFEAVAAADELAKSGVKVRVMDLFSVQPIDRDGLIAASRDCGGTVVTVEDHYAHGGIGDAVASALAGEPARVIKLAVRAIPRSGKPAELLEAFGISARHILEAVRSQIQSTPPFTAETHRTKGFR